jgi:hypothetical protein
MLANVRRESILADANLRKIAEVGIIVANVHFVHFSQLPCLRAGDVASHHEEDGGCDEDEMGLEGHDLHCQYVAFMERRDPGNVERERRAMGRTRCELK